MAVGAIPLPIMQKIYIYFGNCGNPIAENVKKKKNYFGNCGNAIAENGKKNYEICERVKKKSCHVHNIFTINYTWLIIISSKNLWQINCGNGIAEISEKNQVQLTRCKLKYNILILKWCKQKQKKSTQNTSTIFIF